jgi:hypothetical protein
MSDNVSTADQLIAYKIVTENQKKKIKTKKKKKK